MHDFLSKSFHLYKYLQALDSFLSFKISYQRNFVERNLVDDIDESARFQVFVQKPGNFFFCLIAKLFFVRYITSHTTKEHELIYDYILKLDASKYSDLETEILFT